MRVLVAHDAKRALELVRSHKVDVVLTDLMMPGTTGLELLPAVKQVAPDVEVVLMTAFGSVEAAVSAMREGAYDFVEKPLKRLSIVKSVRKAAEKPDGSWPRTATLKDEIKLLTQTRDRRKLPHLASNRRRGDAGGAEPRDGSRPRRERHGQGAPGPVHPRASSARSRAPLRGRELRGHPRDHPGERAFRPRAGLVHRALSPRRKGGSPRPRRGTLVPRRDRRALSGGAGEAPACAPRRESTSPLGGNTVSERTCGSWRRPTAICGPKLPVPGAFVKTSYYRLNVIAITAPPLRARREDVPLLVDHFLGLYCAKNGRQRLEADARRPRPHARVSAGRGTFASWRTSSSAQSSFRRSDSPDRVRISPRAVAQVERRRPASEAGVPDIGTPLRGDRAAGDSGDAPLDAKGDKSRGGAAPGDFDPDDLPQARRRRRRSWRGPLDRRQLSAAPQTVMSTRSD